MSARRFTSRCASTTLAAVVLTLAGQSVARACTSSIFPPLSHYSEHPTYPQNPGQVITFKTVIPAVQGCTHAGEDLKMAIRVEFPGLTPAGRIYYNGMFYPAYEAGPDSPLIIFNWLQSNPASYPAALQVGAWVPAYSAADPNLRFNAQVRFYTRPDGRRLRTIDLTGGRFDIEFGAYPALNGTIPMNLKLVFPAVTCPLDDAVETLDDVPAAELITPGSTARERVVAVRMNCGAHAPRATMTLSDAGDAGNAGSLLAPTADSDAGGVRVQMLRNGTAVKFGQPWNFEPGAGGVHDHAFTARYYRTSDALLPGRIKGEAVLNVDYW